MAMVYAGHHAAVFGGRIDAGGVDGSAGSVAPDGGGHGWQKMISRMELYGEISKDCPSSIARLGKGTCYVSEAMAKPFSHWFYGMQPKNL